jgi:hypothetical protein
MYVGLLPRLFVFKVESSRWLCTRGVNVCGLGWWFSAEPPCDKATAMRVPKVRFRYLIFVHCVIVKAELMVLHEFPETPRVFSHSSLYIDLQCGNVCLY